MIEKDRGAGNPPGWDVPPWLLPGNSRLDAEPHRGGLLRRLANASFLAALASLYPLACPLFAVTSTSLPDAFLWLVPAIGLGLLGGLGSLTVWVLAGRDLRGMQ